MHRERTRKSERQTEDRWRVKATRELESWERNREEGERKDDKKRRKNYLFGTSLNYKA